MSKLIKRVSNIFYLSPRIAILNIFDENGIEILTRSIQFYYYR